MLCSFLTVHMLPESLLPQPADNKCDLLNAGDKEFTKIKVKNAIVDLDGDEMTRYCSLFVVSHSVLLCSKHQVMQCNASDGYALVASAQSCLVDLVSLQHGKP